MLLVDMQTLEVCNSQIADRAEYSHFYKRPSMRCRLHWTTLAEVQAIAERINQKAGKPLYKGVDHGEWQHPRFDIITRPQVGDPVSYTSGGDYYPDGVVVKITDKDHILTSEGHTYRPKLGGWRRTGGTWSLVCGHHSDKDLDR